MTYIRIDDQYTRYLNYIKNDILGLNKINSKFQTKEEWTFKCNPNYNYVLEHVNKMQSEMIINEMKKRCTTFYKENKEFLIELCKKNDTYGHPIKSDINDFTVCSPSNLRYIFHSILILDYIKTNIESFGNSINLIEIEGRIEV